MKKIENQEIRNAWLKLKEVRIILAGVRCTDEPLAEVERAIKGLEWAFPIDTKGGYA